MNPLTFLSPALALHRRLFTLVALLAFSTLGAPAATVSAFAFAVTGTVEFKSTDTGSYAPLTKGQALPIGSTVRTSEGGTATLKTSGGWAVLLGNDSILKINEVAFGSSGGSVTENKAVLRLEQGVITALVNSKTPKITDFRIQTPQGAAAARGTFYAVLVYNHKTYIGVKEGKVAASSL